MKPPVPIGATGTGCAASLLMHVPEEHLRFLRRRDFVVDCAAPNFTSRDRGLLTRYGRWLTALASGKIRPFTPEQEHFLEVVNGQAAVETELERAWMKWTQRRRFEAEFRLRPHRETRAPGEDWMSRQERWRSRAWGAGEGEDGGE